jgi:hypothetical protein
MFQVQDLMAADDYTAPDGTKPAAGGDFGDAFYWFGPPPDDSRLSWEWGGEWTVTFETFRDMGAAFMVALVLIYILVVWEFGNFRIPLVIMAPIPLTLLGIIPAHFIMSQLGLGGEFTATSMIGWIALAGIIVRNSILLVDFSIHEIRRGIPVAEAVIRSCKIRTRPILITALALVAGSSVIITDPIFQGMAISLLAGTVVSTVLTLIVIPLGCVAASQDLCQVAAATATSLPASGLPCQIEAAQAAAAKPLREAGGLRRALAKLGSILTLVFYAVRGIGLLLWDMVKSYARPKAPSKSGSAAAARAASAPARTPGVLSRALGKVAQVLTLIFYGLRGILILLLDMVKSAMRPKPSPRPRPRPSSRGGSGTPGAGPGTPPADTAPATPSAPPAQAAASVSRAQSAAGTSAPAATGKAQTPGAASTKRTARKVVNGSGTGKGVVTRETDATAKKASLETPKPTLPPVQKKAPRRGIRLKIDDDSGDSDR